MNELRENLIDRMIRIYGFEDPVVISFCRLCESWPEGEEWDKGLDTLVKCHEECPVIEDEEDE